MHVSSKIQSEKACQNGCIQNLLSPVCKLLQFGYSQNLCEWSEECSLHCCVKRVLCPLPNVDKYQHQHLEIDQIWKKNLVGWGKPPGKGQDFISIWCLLNKSSGHRACQEEVLGLLPTSTARGPLPCREEIFLRGRRLVYLPAHLSRDVAGLQDMPGSQSSWHSVHCGCTCSCVHTTSQLCGWPKCISTLGDSLLFPGWTVKCPVQGGTASKGEGSEPRSSTPSHRSTPG